MNRQPYARPPRQWPPRLSPWWIRVCRPLRNRTLRRGQRLTRIETQGLDLLRRALDDNAGVLITPNHSFHYDANVLYVVADRVRRPFHFLTAWQVFAMSSRFEQWSLQRHGCFSIDRENNDLGAFKLSVEILRDSPYPLVVFPEGDIYHTNDRVTPFRDGAAAVALAAAKRADRRIVCVPCALKWWFLDDPRPKLLRLMDRLERRLLWRPRPDLPLIERIYRLAGGMLALKEQEYLGAAQVGPVRQRRDGLINTILRRLEQRHGVTKPDDAVPERVKALRRAIIARQEKEDLSDEEQGKLAGEMEDLFTVVQTYSYPGDYVAERPSLERIAETLDKFEEDLFQVTYPGVRGRRRVVVRFGEPINVPREKNKKDAAADLTSELEGRVQGLLDELNAGAAVSEPDA
jgi:1-acyl-sn-glycerol-3-phosphate acyltransferase